MISKTKQAGSSFLEVMAVIVAFCFVSVFTFVLISEPKQKAIVDTQEIVSVKHELLQPVVTELKDYKSLPNQKGLSKLTPVTIAEMRKDPIQPVEPEPVVVPAPQPIIEKSENHYHFEDLNSGITYLASILLVIFVLFFSFKGFAKVAKNMSVKKAIKRSYRILTAFDGDINNSTTYLDYSKLMTEQLRFNETVIEQNNTSHHIPELSVVNDKLKANLTFAERSLVQNLS
jgi:hypothetical protein